MDRKIKKCRRIVLGIGVFVMTAVFTGCAGEQKPKTAETLLQMMEKESESVKSMKCNLILEAETGNAGSASGVKTVSYTHLDVYKRQIVNNVDQWSWNVEN